MNNLIQESIIKFSESFQLPEKIIHADDLPWIPYDDETCQFKPLRFDLTTGNWTYLFKIKGSTVIGRHRHTGGNVIGFNLQGHWRYKDRDWVAKPGSFIFEPPGDIHTLITEGEEDVITLFILGGTLQFFDDDNNILGQDDVFTIYKRYRDYCSKQGIPVREDLVY